MGSMTSCESLLDADLGASDALPGSLSVGGTERVAIIGSGNWGSAIARIIGQNVTEQVLYRRHQITTSYTYTHLYLAIGLISRVPQSAYPTKNTFEKFYVVAPSTGRCQGQHGGFTKTLLIVPSL